MKKVIIVTLATALLAAPAMAGLATQDAPARPSVQQNSAASPKDATTPGSPADKQDDKNKGLSRNSEDCNKGCVGGNPP
jgi:hypothetical protein